MNKFIFDVDGTLTPSRGIIDEKFKTFFNEFCRTNPVYLVTGSDKPKTIEQIGEDTYNLCKRVYQCSGSDVWDADTNILKSGWTLPDLARTFLISCEYESPFSIRTGNHIEERPGMVNFSVVGRNASLYERKQYVDFDKQNDERNTIAKAFNTMFPELEATIGGETGIDIAPKGLDKGQITKDFDKHDYINFFGDAIFEGGNDWALAEAFKNKKFKNATSINVSNWQETWDHLRQI
jgi:phosphomannomutase